MIKSTKYFTITAGGTPQPLVGTSLTAAAAVPTDSRNTVVNLAVADSSTFRQGQWIQICNADGTVPERHHVVSVPDATHVKVRNLATARAIGAWVLNSEQVNSVYVQSKDGNAGALYICNSATAVKATGVGVIAVLQKVASGVQPVEWSTKFTVGQNPIDLCELWIDGTTADSYLPSFNVT